MQQRIEWDEVDNKCYLVTQNDDGSITNEPLSPEEAAKWTAENKW